MLDSGYAVEISGDNIDNIEKSPLIPLGIIDKIDKFLIYLYRNTSYLGDKARINPAKSLGITYSPNKIEFERILTYIEKNGLVAINHDTLCELTVIGLDYVANLLKTKAKSNKCFIAMSFSKELNHNLLKQVGW